MEAIDWCLGKALSSTEGESSHIWSFFAALKALRLHLDHGGLTKSKVEKVVGIAHSLLSVSNVKVGTSRLSFLYTEVYEILAELAIREGRCWEGLVSHHRAQLMSRRGTGTDRQAELAFTGEQMLRLGHGAAALEMLTLANGAGKSSLRHDLATARAQRLLCRFDEAKATLEILQARPQVLADERLQAMLEWESQWTLLLQTGDLKPLATLHRSHKGRRFGRHAVNSWLWLQSSPQVDHADIFPTTAAMKRWSQEGELPVAPFDEALHAAATIVEQLYDREIPLHQRLDKLGELMPLARRCLGVEHTLLVMAAGARWLARFNQIDLACCFLEEYRALSRQASGTASDDVLGTLEDLSMAKLLGRVAHKNPLPVADASAFQRGAISRMAELSLAVTQLGTMLVKGKLVGLFLTGPQRDAHRLKTQEDVATFAATFLSRRKGVLLKLGQICSYFKGPIGTHVTSRLEVLQADVTAMPPELSRQVFVEEFGKTPEEAFATFDALPFAAGSIGQVHRATLKNGRVVAVKIQYPHVRDLIHFEIRASRLAKGMIERLLPSVDFEAILAEVRTQLIAETDYMAEAAHQTRFRLDFAHDPDVLVPEVVREWTSSRVLTADLIVGQDFQTFSQTAAPEERGRAAETMMRVAMRSVYTIGMLNSDPQPGNFLFSDGRVAFIDFGSMKTLGARGVALADLHRALFSGDDAALVEAFVRAGFVPSAEGIHAAGVRSLFELIDEFAMKDEPYRFDAEFPKRVFQRFTEENPFRETFRLPPEFFFSSRIDFGLSSVLAVLGVEVNYRKVMLAALFEGKREGTPSVTPLPKTGAD